MEDVVVISDTEDTDPEDKSNTNRNVIKLVDINTIMQNDSPPTNIQPLPINNVLLHPLGTSSMSANLAKIVIPTSYLLTNNGLKSSGNIMQAVQINNQNILLMTVPSNITTQKTPITKTETRKSQPPTVKPQKPTRNLCCEYKKKTSKIDLEGFSTYDRLGFYNNEETRSRRCLRVLNTHINVREECLKSLINAGKKEKCDSKVMEGIKKRTRRSTKTTKSAVLKQIKNKKSCSDDLTFSKKLQHFYEIRVNANRNDCEGYQNCLVPTSYSKFTYSQLVNFKTQSNTYFVNSTNVRDVDNIKRMEPTSNIYFINENNVITNLYMDCLPSLKDKVTVIDELVYDKYKNRESKNKSSNKILKNGNRIKTKKKLFNKFLHKFHLDFSSNKNR